MSDDKARDQGCECNVEEGDSSCPVHGDCPWCGGLMPECCDAGDVEHRSRGRIATLERELAEMLRDWTEDVNKCERVERELAAVSAERDALRSELAEARALLADVTATRDSYREDYKAWRQKFTDLYNKTGGAPPTGTPGDGTR